MLLGACNMAAVAGILQYENAPGRHAHWERSTGRGSQGSGGGGGVTMAAERRAGACTHVHGRGWRGMRPRPLRPPAAPPLLPRRPSVSQRAILAGGSKGTRTAATLGRQPARVHAGAAPNRAHPGPARAPGGWHARAASSTCACKAGGESDTRRRRGACRVERVGMRATGRDSRRQCSNSGRAQWRLRGLGTGSAMFAPTGKRAAHLIHA